MERIKGVKTIHKKYAMLFIIVLFTLFRGLRWEVGSDWQQFHDYFYMVEFGNLLELKRGGGGLLEPGYALLNLFVNFICKDYTAFLIVLNLIILVIFYNCAWKYFPENPVNVFVCILLMDIFFPLRFNLASSVVLFSYRYVLTREFVKFAIIIAIAASIHFTSLLVLPVYFLLNRKFSARLLISIFCISVYVSLFSLFLTEIIEVVINIASFFTGADYTLLIRMANYTTFETYETTEKSFQTLFLMFARSFCLMCLFFLFKEKFKENGYYNLFYNCFFLALFIGIIFKFQMSDVLRMQAFFNYGTAILFGAILGKLPFVKSRIFLCFLFLYILNTQTNNKLIRTFTDEFIPYKTIFGG
jgi:hypothetical protein